MLRRPGNGIGWILSMGASSLEGPHGQVDQPGAPVVGRVLRAAVEVEAHLLQDREFDLHELGRHPAHRQFRLGDDGGGDQAHRLDRVLGGRVVHVRVDDRHAVHRQRRRADALDADAQLLQEEAQVLDHVVGRGVADDRDAVVAGGGQQGVLGDGVPAFGQHDRPRGGDARFHLGVVDALRRGHRQTEVAQRAHVRLDGAGAQVAAARVGEAEAVHAVQQRAEEHDDAPGAARGFVVDGVQVQFGGRHDLQVGAAVDPPGADADRGEHLQDPVDLLDAGDPTQHRTARVEQRGAEQCSATHAFLLVLTSMLPDSRRPPTTRRCIGPE